MQEAKKHEYPFFSKMPLLRIIRTVLLKPEPSKRKDIHRSPLMLPEEDFSRCVTKSPSAFQTTFGT